MRAARKYYIKYKGIVWVQYIYYVGTDRLKKGFHTVCYIGTMPQLVQIETRFFGTILCMSPVIIIRGRT